MNSNRRNVLRFLYVFVFTFGLLFFIFYPLVPRHVTVCMNTNQGEIKRYILNDEIANEKQIKWEWNYSDLKLYDVRFYGTFMSLPLRTMSHSEFVNMMIWDGTVPINADMIWESDSAHVIAREGGTIWFYTNEAFSDVLSDVSNTFYSDRILTILCWVFVMGIVYVFLESFEMKKANKQSNYVFGKELSRFRNDLKKYRQYIVFGAKSDMKAEVSNSYLNRLWWLLEPLLNMIVYVIVFGNLLGNTINNYALFVFSALIMWNFFCRSVNSAVQLMRVNRDILSKVYVPKFVLLLELLLLNVYKLFFSLIILFPMLIWGNVKMGFGIVWAIVAYVLCMLFTFGLGMILLHFGVYVDDLAYAVSISMNILMFISGIFYNLITALPEPLNILVLILNPMALCIDTMRNGLLYNTWSSVPFVLVWIALSCLLSYIGIHVVYKNENGYVKVI